MEYKFTIQGANVDEIIFNLEAAAKHLKELRSRDANLSAQKTLISANFTIKRTK